MSMLHSPIYLTLKGYLHSKISVILAYIKCFNSTPKLILFASLPSNYISLYI